MEGKGTNTGKEKANDGHQKPSTVQTAGPGMAGRLIPPAGGATVRMYRIGHGDCFLLAFPGAGEKEPVYVLIDCGYKPGSPQFIQTTVDEIVSDIKTATGGRIDVAIITHEHQDHVNGISAARFQGLNIRESWFAWTEDPDDDIANQLRKEFKDKLLGLIAARQRLAAVGDNNRVKGIDDFLAFELGGEDEAFDAKGAAAALGAAAGAGGSRNKESMRVFKQLATHGIKFLRPHQEILQIPGAKGVRVFAMGPPRDAELLKSLDPTGGEEFHSLATSSAGNFFAAAVRTADSQDGSPSPFARRYRVAWKAALASTHSVDFFRERYGPTSSSTPGAFGADNPPWRRIDNDWLFAADRLALDMNDQTNNSSLVLAFEIGGPGGKVLLFAADAQRGNWISWSKRAWRCGDEKVTAKDLLSRTVLYKVGHHGSHNATLNGRDDDSYANLEWMAVGPYAREFTAMITAVRKWAETQKGWDHPLKAIKDALLKKAAGRVFQTDTDVDGMAMPAGASGADWKAFENRRAGHRLYFDYSIMP